MPRRRVVRARLVVGAPIAGCSAMLYGPSNAASSPTPMFAKVSNGRDAPIRARRTLYRASLACAESDPLSAVTTTVDRSSNRRPTAPRGSASPSHLVARDGPGSPRQHGPTKREKRNKVNRSDQNTMLRMGNVNAYQTEGWQHAWQQALAPLQKRIADGWAARMRHGKELAAERVHEVVEENAIDVFLHGCRCDLQKR